MLLTYLRYLRTVMVHKRYVFVESRKFGIAWRGFWHDMSKLRPDEFAPYARYYGLPEEKRPIEEPAELETAWQRHISRNPHHWEHWVENNVAKEIDEKSRIEMLCDWRAIGHQHIECHSSREYYLGERESDRIKLGPKTKIWVEQMLGIVDEIEK